MTYCISWFLRNIHQQCRKGQRLQALDRALSPPILSAYERTQLEGLRTLLDDSAAAADEWAFLAAALLDTLLDQQPTLPPRSPTRGRRQSCSHWPTLLPLRPASAIAWLWKLFCPTTRPPCPTWSLSRGASFCTHRPIASIDWVGSSAFGRCVVNSSSQEPAEFVVQLCSPNLKR